MLAALLAKNKYFWIFVNKKQGSSFIPNPKRCVSFWKPPGCSWWVAKYTSDSFSSHTSPSLNQTTLCNFPREDVPHNWSDKIAAGISQRGFQKGLLQNSQLHTISSNLIQCWMWHERNTSICQESTSTNQLQETGTAESPSSLLPLHSYHLFVAIFWNLASGNNHLICQRHTDDCQVTHQ